VSALAYTLIFLETPHRLLLALTDMLKELGDRELTVAREITKLHEEFFRGRISTALAHYTTNQPRGEITLILAGNRAEKEIWPEEQLLSALKDAKSQGSTPAKIAKQLAGESGWPRREIYQLLIEME
jgi:16S rRNA (cytidine1402-2'-O)-methyltransferase